MYRSTGIGVSCWLGGLLGVALVLSALALPQSCVELLTQAPRVDIAQGQQYDLRLVVLIEQPAIGGPKITSVQLLDRRGFLITGKEQGSTGLLIWTGCSPELLRSLMKVEGRGSVDTRGAPAFTAGTAEELPNQVQTGIHFVGVSRSKLKQASTSFVRRDDNLWVPDAPGSLGGIKIDADGNGLGGTFDTGSSGFNLIFDGGKRLSFINVLEDGGFAYTPTHPSLAAMGRQSVSLLTGGGFLIPVPSDTNDNVTIEYKEFGIRLTLTPTVMDNRCIILRMAPEVSELDHSAGIQSGGVAVSMLRVRRADTSMMLAGGESFVISGLTSSNSVGNVDGFSRLGDIPIFGAFFRSTKLDKDDRELLMIVTPHLVQPPIADTQLPDPPGEGLWHYDPGFSRLYFLKRGEYNGQQNDTGLSDQGARMSQNFVALTQHPGELDWLQNSLMSAGQMVPVDSTSLEELLALLDVTAAGVLFISLGKSNLMPQGTLVGGSVSTRPMFSAVATGDGLDNQLVPVAMRVGVYDPITYGARTSELTRLTRRPGGRPPSVPASATRQGELLTLVSVRPDADDAFVALHLAKALRGQTPNQVLLLGVGQPTGEALMIPSLDSAFTSSDALYNLRRLDQALIDSTFTRLDSDLWVPSLTDESGVLEQVTTVEFYLLLGNLREASDHMVVNLTGLPEGEPSNQLLVQANRVLWMVDQSVPFCGGGPEHLRHLYEHNLPLPSTELLIERYLPNVAPGQQAFSRMLDLDLFSIPPLSPESCLCARNLGRGLFEVAPCDPLTVKLRQLASSLCATRGERCSLPSWLDRAKAALL